QGMFQGFRLWLLGFLLACAFHSEFPPPSALWVSHAFTITQSLIDTKLGKPGYAAKQCGKAPRPFCGFRPLPFSPSLVMLVSPFGLFVRWGPFASRLTTGSPLPL